ncbi:hypothetical protein [Sorangium sp. So ce1151]|uniref:hypothetical protein n=1 Tax=Sorangium sp. So ce1151 TaxID=3133332 RepID=UPI003F63BA91
MRPARRCAPQRARRRPDHALSTQDRAITTLAAPPFRFAALHFFALRSGFFYLRAESGSGWTDFAGNAAFLTELLQAAETLGLRVGIYTSASEWSRIINSMEFSAYPLWYAHYSRPLDFTFDDYYQSPFGGWASPVMKQLTGNETCNGITYDRNWAPSIAAASRPTPASLPSKPSSPAGRRSPGDVRACAVSIANDAVGLGANPHNPTSRASYLALIAPGETPAMQEAMGKMSGCGLVVAGIWRDTGVTSSHLDAPYVVASAISRLVTIAWSANAWVRYEDKLAPSPGDMVLLDADGPHTHVYTVITIERTSTGYALTSVDGGQVDRQGCETILLKSRTWASNHDTVKAQGVNWGSTKTISGWIDVTRLPLK